MLQKTTLSLCASLAFAILPVKNADAEGWKDLLNAVNNRVNAPAHNAGQPLQPGWQAINPAQAVQAGSLTELLMQRTGVNQTQAERGAGALFQIAKNKMQADAFAQLEQSVPGMQGMLGAVPVLTQAGGLAGSLSALTGASGGTAASLLTAVSVFQQQGMSPAMVQQFIPVLIDYVKARGSEALVNSLSGALTGQ